MRQVVIRNALLAAAALAMSAGVAHAAVVVNPDGSVTVSGDSGGSWTVDFDGYGGEPPAVIAGLTSSITFTFISALNGTYTFSYSVTNTSTAAHPESRVSAFGFDTNPDFSSATVSGVYSTVDSGNVPNIGMVEFCATNVNCAGGGGGGVGFGDTGGGQFTLTFAGGENLSSITLSDFFVRYQSTGLNGEDSAVGRPTVVPEPGTWAMMLLGFAGVGMALRRRRRMSALPQVA